MYAEMSYPFPGTVAHHFQHIAAYEEMKRRKRIDADNRAALRQHERRNGSRRWN